MLGLGKPSAMHSIIISSPELTLTSIGSLTQTGGTINSDIESNIGDNYLNSIPLTSSKTFCESEPKALRTIHV